jgi:drug/metabolite transporter (DMT)-like permease
MGWFFYALLGALLMTAYSLSIRLLLKDRGDAKTFTFITTSFGCLALFILTLFERPVHVINLQLIGVFILLSFLFAVTDLLFIRGRQLEEVSVVSMLVQFGSLWALIGGFVFLKEPLTARKVIGVLLLIIGNFVLLFNKQKFSLSKGKYLILLATITFTISSFVDKVLSPQYSPSLYKGILFLLESLILYIFFLPNRLKSIRNEINIQGKMIYFVGPLLSFSMFFLIKAFQAGGEASKVLPVFSLSLVFSVLAGIIFLNERNNLVKKILATIIVSIGIYILQLY